MNQSNLNRSKRQNAFYAIGGLVIGASAAAAVVIASYYVLLRDDGSNETSTSLRGSGESYTYMMPNLNEGSSFDATTNSNDKSPSLSSLGASSTTLSSVSTEEVSQVTTSSERNETDVIDTHELAVNQVQDVTRGGIFSEYHSIPTRSPSKISFSNTVPENLFVTSSPKTAPTYDILSIPTYEPTVEVQFPTTFPTTADESNQEVTPMTRSNEVGFRLKKFWQTGYYWQEETQETWWCMSCFGGACQSGMKLQIQDCKTKSPRDTQFSVISHGIWGDQIRVVNTNLCLQKMGVTRTILLRRCEENSFSQRFIGVESNEKFDIHPFNDTDLCLSNHHHPKSNETIYAEFCDRSRRAKSSYWITY